MAVPVPTSDQTAGTVRLWSACNDVVSLGLVTQIRRHD
jgi:hypothetical protein